MAQIRKELAGSAPGYTWENDGDVIEVDRETADQLLDIPHGGFSEVYPEGDASEPDGSEEVVEAPAKAKRTTKKAAAVTETAAEQSIEDEAAGA